MKGATFLSNELDFTRTSVVSVFWTNRSIWQRNTRLLWSSEQLERLKAHDLEEREEKLLCAACVVVLGVCVKEGTQCHSFYFTICILLRKALEDIEGVW